VFPQYEDRVYICGFSLFVYGSRRRPIEIVVERESSPHAFGLHQSETCAVGEAEELVVVSFEDVDGALAMGGSNLIDKAQFARL